MEKLRLKQGYTQLYEYNDEEEHLVIKFGDNASFTIKTEYIDEEKPHFDKKHFHPKYKLNVGIDLDEKHSEFTCDFWDSIVTTSKDLELHAFNNLMSSLSQYITEIDSIEDFEMLGYEFQGEDRLSSIKVYIGMVKTYNAFKHIFDEANIGIICSNLLDIEEILSNDGEYCVRCQGFFSIGILKETVGGCKACSECYPHIHDNC